MKIPEIVYEIRNLARKETDPVKKDLFFQSAKALEILGNMAKISDLAVAEYRASNKPSQTDEEGVESYNINEVTLQMLEEHLETLINYSFLSTDDRWPYGNNEILKFTPKYLKSQIVKDSNME
jgi:hypothetical protein